MKNVLLERIIKRLLKENVNTGNAMQYIFYNEPDYSFGIYESEDSGDNTRRAVKEYLIDNELMDEENIDFAKIPAEYLKDWDYLTYLNDKVGVEIENFEWEGYYDKLPRRLGLKLKQMRDQSVYQEMELIDHIVEELERVSKTEGTGLFNGTFNGGFYYKDHPRVKALPRKLMWNIERFGPFADASLVLTNIVNKYIRNNDDAIISNYEKTLTRVIYDYVEDPGFGGRAGKNLGKIIDVGLDVKKVGEDEGVASGSAKFLSLKIRLDISFKLTDDELISKINDIYASHESITQHDLENELQAYFIKHRRAQGWSSSFILKGIIRAFDAKHNFESIIVKHMGAIEQGSYDHTTNKRNLSYEYNVMYSIMKY